MEHQDLVRVNAPIVNTLGQDVDPIWTDEVTLDDLMKADWDKKLEEALEAEMQFYDLLGKLSREAGADWFSPSIQGIIAAAQRSRRAYRTILGEAGILEEW